VLCTIHQPSSELFLLFDKLILLMHGHVIYEGPAHAAVDHFAEIGYPCPEYSNPADYFMMEVMQYKGEEDDEQRLKLLLNAYTQSKTLIDAKEAGSSEKRQLDIGSLENYDSSKSRATPWTQFKMLGWRAFANFSRDKFATLVRLGQNVFTALLIGLLYLNMGNNQSSISDRNGAVFVIMMNNFLSSLSSVILAFSSEKTVVLRETATGLYNPATYFLSKTMCEYPIQLSFPLVNSSIIYFLSGFQRKASKFGLFLISNILIVSVGQSFGILVATIAPSAPVALAMFPMVVLPLTLLSGLFTTSENLGPWIRWLETLSPFKYGFRVLMINEFKGLALACDGSEQTPPNSGVCLVTRGEQVLKLQGIDPDMFSENQGIIFAFFLTCMLASFSVLMLKSRRH